MNARQRRKLRRQRERERGPDVLLFHPATWARLCEEAHRQLFGACLFPTLINKPLPRPPIDEATFESFVAQHETNGGNHGA